MVKYNNTNIPDDKFAEVTIGNNGARIIQKTVVSGTNKTKDTTIYLRAEDIMAIFVQFIAGANESDEIETVYLGNESAVDIDDENSDIIMDASY